MALLFIDEFFFFFAFQKLDYTAYSSSLYGNDRVPLQYSGYYPVPGYHATPTSFNISNLNFVGVYSIDILFYELGFR